MEQHFIDNIDPGEHAPRGLIDQADVGLRVGHGESDLLNTNLSNLTNLDFDYKEMQGIPSEIY